MAPAADEPIARLVDLSVQEGRLDQAINDLNAIVVKQPACDLAYYYLGWVYSLQGRYAEAVAAYKAAICLNPANPQYYYDLAETLALSGQHELAACYYIRVRDLAPVGSDLYRWSLIKLRDLPEPDDDCLEADVISDRLIE